MNTLTINHDNGHSSVYQLIIDGNNLPIAYKRETQQPVIDVLERCRKNRTRIIVDYGDTKTGRSWNEEFNTKGYVGLSRGFQARFPILVYNSRSLGGGSLLDDCIIKITETKTGKVLYQLPTIVK